MKRKGFTIVELMVVLAIIGILMAVAIPIYKKTIIHSRLDEARIYMSAIMAAEKRYKMEYGSYWAGSGSGDIETCDETLFASTLGLKALQESANFYYKVSCNGNCTTPTSNNWDLRITATLMKDNSDATGCTLSDNKTSSDRWVTTDLIGKNVYLCYPAPTSGLQASGTCGISGTTDRMWEGGVSVTDVLQ